ncbi:hypothetical protein [Halorarius halobius]|uniref:hypothetical protein n=1 Tax=Halorarius halobius TaxID=2962671 RepID=UPI0020CE8B78|nr:hypothetical protein [Halorarius halobius]
MDPIDELLLPATALVFVGAALVHVAAGARVDAPLAFGLDAFTWLGVAYLGLGSAVSAVYARGRRG